MVATAKHGVVGGAAQTTVHKGRGAVANPGGRFDASRSDWDDDGWGSAEAARAERPSTTVQWDHAGGLISQTNSPDLPFRRSINPYRGCEHGCAYCFARPSHAWLNLSPGLDFETKLFAKRNAADALRATLAKPSYRPEPLVVGINTDAYQPIERRLKITRSLLELLSACRHPVSLITKSALIERDIDLLRPMAEQGLVSASVSLTTLDRKLNVLMEPRAAEPARRLRIIRALSAAGVPVTVMVAPVIVALTDTEMESILQRAAEAGATSAGYVTLRLPYELRELFPQWLQTHLPDRAAHVLSMLRQMHGGQLYHAEHGARMRGRGPIADMVAARFALACRRLGLDRERPPLRCDLFRRPQASAGQLDMFAGDAR